MALALSAKAAVGDSSAFFNTLPPGSDDIALFNRSPSANNHGEAAPRGDGDYRIPA
jgi:hypothetical protein